MGTRDWQQMLFLITFTDGEEKVQGNISQVSNIHCNYQYEYYHQLYCVSNHLPITQGLSPQGIVCVWIARICYAVAIISSTMYGMHTIHTLDITLLKLMAEVLVLQFMWFLVHKDFRSIIVGLLLTVVSCM